MVRRWLLKFVFSIYLAGTLLLHLTIQHISLSLFLKMDARALLLLLLLLLILSLARFQFYFIFYFLYPSPRTDGTRNAASVGPFASIAICSSMFEGGEQIWNWNSSTYERDGVHIDIDRNRWTVWQTQFDDGVVLWIWRHDENSDEKTEKGSSLKWNAGRFEKGGDSLSKRKEERERVYQVASTMENLSSWTFGDGIVANKK